MKVDASQVDGLANTLSAAPLKVDPVKLVTVEAHKMRDQWRGVVRGARGLRGLEGALSYDVTPGIGFVSAEVGYDQQGQGEIGNIAEFGTSTQAPKRPAGQRVVEDAADRIEKYLGPAAVVALQ